MFPQGAQDELMQEIPVTANEPESTTACLTCCQGGGGGTLLFAFRKMRGNLSEYRTFSLSCLQDGTERPLKNMWITAKGDGTVYLGWVVETLRVSL